MSVSDPLHHDYLKALRVEDRPKVPTWMKVCALALVFSSLVGNITLSWTTWRGNPAVKKADAIAACRSQLAANESAAFDDAIFAATVTKEPAAKVAARIAVFHKVQEQRLNVSQTCAKGQVIAPYSPPPEVSTP